MSTTLFDHSSWSSLEYDGSVWIAFFQVWDLMWYSYAFLSVRVRVITINWPISPAEPLSRDAFRSTLKVCFQLQVQACRNPNLKIVSTSDMKHITHNTLQNTANGTHFDGEGGRWQGQHFTNVPGGASGRGHLLSFAGTNHGTCCRGLKLGQDVVRQLVEQTY
eukprot:1314778-Amphidinium_carterae.1